MSRSRKKTPILQNAGCSSEAWDKKTWHRAQRHGEDLRLHHAGDEYIQTHRNGYRTRAEMSKDGRHWLRESLRAKFMRK